jgi:tetratricopeptide (TPR) repeat protein/tRNA A-37 threonylcarbamoyl transferase component Bud32
MNEQSLFHEALGKPPGERAAFLDATCAGQPDLRAAVESLLAAHEAAGSFLDKPAGHPGQTVDPDPGESAGLGATGAHTLPPEEATLPPTIQRSTSEAGTVIAGRYTLEQKLGEGGMGEVWVAKQTEPVKRRVALKLIKTGMDSKAVLARFEQERQALALMDHPNIARVLDGGMTPTGQPFFVMELVNGLALTRFCDEMKLTPRERLELFVPICQAVQHAHQKGIIHRDLKPANILITMIDGRPVPKVIDFGVAKAVAGKLTDETMSTQFGAVVGTLEYMSPEQAGFSGQDIDTRADIYSLGIILYELLTGLRPIDVRRFRAAALFDMIRIIQEEEPSRPSTRLSTDASLPTLASVRQTEPRKLMAMLRGELDWVVMKCLEKQRDRRYETANALARDIQRYLADEPVEARPPSAGYRLRKLLRRNRAVVLTCLLVAAALLMGTAAATWQAVRATCERDDKEIARANEARQRQQADEERRRAQRAEKEAIEQAEIAAAIATFLQEDLLRQADASAQVDRGFTANPKLTLRELLDRASAKIGERFKDRPRVEMAVRQVIGNTYGEIGQAKFGVPHLERALLLSQQALGGSHPDTLGRMHDLSLAYFEVGELERAHHLVQQAQALTKSAAEPDKYPIERLLHVLAVIHQSSGRPTEAIPIWKKLLAKYRADPDNRTALTIQNNLGLAYQDAGQSGKALPILQQALKGYQKQLGSDHPLTLNCMHNLGTAYGKAGQLNQAIPLLEHAWSKRKASLEPGHPFTLRSQMNLATAYKYAGRTDDALRLLEDGLKTTTAKYGDDHLDTLTALHALASVYQAVNRLDRAQSLYQRALEKRRTRLGVDHPDTLTTQSNLAAVYWQLGQLDRSIPLFEDAVTHLRRKLGVDHPHTLHTIANLGINYRDAGRSPDAIRCLEEVVTTARKRGPPSDDLEWVSVELANTYSQSGQPAKAEPLYRQAMNRRQPSDPSRAGFMSQLSLMLLRQGKFREAEPILRKLVGIHGKSRSDHWSAFNARSMLGEALSGQKKYAEAEPLLLAGYEGLKRRAKSVPPEGSFLFDEALERLVRHHEALGKEQEAAKWRRELNAIKAARKKAEKQ